MRARVVPAVLAALTLLTGLEASGQSTPDSLDAELESIRVRYAVPGLSAMVIKGGRIAAQGAAGVRRIGDPTPLGLEDPVNIGSCSKWLTATLAGRLVDRGVIAWSTRIRDVFPNHRAFNPAYLEVTLEELLAHRGGVPEGVIWEQRFRTALLAQNGTLQQLRRWVADVTLADRPQVARGTELYSNQGYALAAVMLELQTGQSWETLMAEEVFEPLGMASARIGSTYTDNLAPPRGVVGHDTNAPGSPPFPRPALSAADLLRYQASNGPAGMVISSLRDWARFLRRHGLGGEGYLAPATAAKLCRPYVGEEGYGLGVGVLNREWAMPGPALNHTGDILGHTSLFWVAPGRDLIIVVFANIAARNSLSGEARGAVSSLLLSRYKDAAPTGPYLEGGLAPSITKHPLDLAVAPGGTAQFSVEVAGAGPFTYQWMFNDEPIAGATESRLVVPDLSLRDAGYYAVVVGNAEGHTASRAAQLRFPGETSAGWLSNLSVLTRLGPRQTLSVGFTLAGGAKPLLLRAVGPGLAPLGVAGSLANPRLDLFAGSRWAAGNDGSGAGPAVSAATAMVGAFPLPAGSGDAVLLRTMSGSATLEISGSTAVSDSSAEGGGVLVEVYDAGAGSSPRLANLSVLHGVGPGSEELVAGFTLAGGDATTLLLRAIGPGLIPLGLAEPLENPRIELFRADGVRLSSNDDWPPELASAFARVGAFSLPAGSRDAALLIRLPPGGYTIQVFGADARRGRALVEIYELP